MKHVEVQWLIYRNHVIPPDASEAQLTECRRSFYAGAFSVLRTVTIAMDPDSQPTEKDERMLEVILQELNEFIRELKPPGRVQ